MAFTQNAIQYRPLDTDSILTWLSCLGILVYKGLRSFIWLQNSYHYVKNSGHVNVHKACTVEKNAVD